ncbi:beta-defensin 130 [Octodon degus]|uniref:Beta-defensin 130 n=1 Tax=Octodon degus TaxID=10160 RepID=A0A6P3F5C2_OCTDE|nr:beta-defensin 130 [Octodon degus]
MRFYSLLPMLLLLVTILAKGRAGVIPGEKQCILLKGTCKHIACTSIDDTIGVCSEDKKCCRKWWVFEPYATPVPKGKSP